MMYLGIDHHKHYSQVVVMDKDGITHLNRKINNDKESIETLKRRFNQPIKAVIEAGHNWGKMYDLLEESNIATEVAHPLKVRAIAEARIKTDSIDAKTLAHLLRTDLIPSVHVPSKEVREQKNLLRYRLWLVKLQTMTKNRIYNVLDRNSIDTKGLNIFAKKTREQIKNLSLKDIDKKLLKDHYDILEVIEQHIKDTESWIDSSLKDNQYIAILDSMPGFAKILSALAALEIDNVERFAHPGKFASYCGLIPSTYSSGGKTYHGRLICTCNSYLKYAFIEAAWASIRSSTYCRSCYEKIKESKGSNVAIVSLARRLSQIAYKCLKENRKYEERPYLQ